MNSIAGISNDSPKSSLGLSPGRNASATVALGGSSTTGGGLGGIRPLPPSPLSNPFEARAHTPPLRHTPSPLRRLPHNPDGSGGGSEDIRGNVRGNGSPSGGNMNEDVNGVNVNGAPGTASPSRSPFGISVYTTQQPTQTGSPPLLQPSPISQLLHTSPQSVEPTEPSTQLPAQRQHPNLPLQATPEIQRRTSSVPSAASGGASISGSGTPDASSSRIFDPSTSSTSLGSASVPNSGASSGLRSGSPSIHSGSPGMLSAGPGVRSTSPRMRSASPAGGKFMHPPRPPYSAWMNTSSGDVSQTRTQTPPPRADTWAGQVQKGEAQVNHVPTAPGSMLSPASKHTATATIGIQGPETAGSTHGPGVRRMSVNQVMENPGTSPTPSNRLSGASNSGPIQPLMRGTLPIGNGSNNRTPVTVVERLQQRARSDSEPRRASTSVPLDTIFDDAFAESSPGAHLHRKNTTDSVTFPQTPHEFSPLLSPSLELASFTSPPSNILSLNRRTVQKAPLMDPAPPPKRRSRPPLPIGPRKPSVRGGIGGMSQPSGLRALSLSPVLVHGPPSSSSSSSSIVGANTNTSAAVASTTRKAPSTHSDSSGSGKGSQMPPSPKFRTRPVRWRGLTMDAAKWTLTSGQLQDIVGRAIRQSAEASSIRLLTLEVLDKEIPEEIKRLELLRDEIKTKYRGAAQRRRVLLRSLTLYAEGIDAQTRTRLGQDLLEVSIVCDQLTEELFHVMDDLQQLNRLRDVHSASALAMALRKLNSSLIRGSPGDEQKHDKARSRT